MHQQKNQKEEECQAKTVTNVHILSPTQDVFSKFPTLVVIISIKDPILLQLKSLAMMSHVKPIASERVEWTFHSIPLNDHVHDESNSSLSCFNLFNF